MADVIKQVLGPVSAYALAKQQGYSGTLEEWAQDQANAGANAAAAKKSAEDAAAILEQIKENNKSYDEEINKLKALKPEDIGAQPAGNYALKNEIPAPYTLPTATADTLGGVKSSEAVTVNADGTMTVNQLNGKDASEYLQTSQVVNNFTTTAEGYVADARALKVLNDKLARTGYTPTFIGCTNNNVVCYKVAGLVLVSGRFDVGESAITGITNFISGLPVGSPNTDILALDMTSNGEHVRVQFFGTVIKTVYTTLKANQQYSINLVYVAD